MSLWVRARRESIRRREGGRAAGRERERERGGGERERQRERDREERESAHAGKREGGRDREREREEATFKCHGYVQSRGSVRNCSRERVMERVR